MRMTFGLCLLLLTLGRNSQAEPVNAIQQGPYRVQICDGPTSAANCTTITGNKVDVNATVTGTVGINQTGTANDVDVLTLPANATVDVNRIAGSATSTAAAGVQKVGVVGSAGAAFDSANDAAAPANVLAIGVETADQGTNGTAATAGRQRRALGSLEGVLYTQEGNGNRFSCLVNNVTATTECRALLAGFRAYVTSVSLSNQAATVQSLDVVYGTGTNCGTGTAALTHKFQMGTNATTTSPQSIVAPFITPLVPATANAICVRPSAASAFGATVTGFFAK